MPSEDKPKVASKTKENKRKKNSNKEVIGSPNIKSSELHKIHSENLRDKNVEANENKDIIQAGKTLESPVTEENNSAKLLIHPKDTVISATEMEKNNIISIETNSSLKMKALSQERENLRVEVQQLRKALEEIQNQHSSDLFSIKRQSTDQLSDIKVEHNEEISVMEREHAKEVATLKTELEESNKAKDIAETQYQHLLERVNTIKSSLGERLKADKEELAESKTRIEELEILRETQIETIEDLRTETDRLKIEHHESLKEISSLRIQNNLSEQNLALVREEMALQLRKLRNEAEAAKEATGSWEMLAMEERAMRENLLDRNKDLEEQILSLQEVFDATILEKKNNLEAFEMARKSLHDSLESRNREYLDLVESHEGQLKALRKLLQDSDTRVAEAESSRDALQAEIERMEPMKNELKEKNLLIGKLRHEAIVLNDHLTKALRLLKKARPEDNIDRQIVTNHFLHFLALDRSDPKKFQILQLIASLLNWTDEQKEQAGLARPGTLHSSHRFPSPNFHRTASTTSLTAETFNESSARKESLVDLWKNFLEHSAEESDLQNRSGDISVIPASRTEGGR